MDSKTCCDGLKLILMDFEMPVLNGLEVFDCSSYDNIGFENTMSENEVW